MAPPARFLGGASVGPLLIWLGFFTMLSFQVAQGIHEDQLGRFDWHRRYLGKYSTALFGKTRARVAVASNRNALAVLGLRTGEVEWRQVFGDTDQIQQAVMTERPAALFTLSSDGKDPRLRAWNQHTGALVWDMPTCAGAALNPNCGATALAHMESEQTESLQKAVLFVVSCGELKAVNTSTAEVAWTHILPEGTVGTRLLPNPLATSLSVIAISKDRAEGFIEVADLSALDGGLLKAARIHVTDAMGTVNASQITLSRGTVIVPASGGSTICEAPVIQGAEFSCRPLSEVLGEVPATALASLTPGQPFSSILLKVTDVEHNAPGHFLVDATKSGLVGAQVHKLDTFDTTCVMHLEGGGDVIAGVTSSAKGVWWGVFDGATGAELHREEVQDFQRWHRGSASVDVSTAIDQCFLAAFTRKDGGTGWRLLAVASDDSAVLLQQEKVVWVREESLAGVTTSLAVDFPKTSGGLEGTKGLSAMQNLRKQILTLKTQMGMASVAEAAELSELRHAGSDVMLSTPDPSGFRKLLVALSDTGKLLALHNGDGHVVWGRSYNSACPPEVLHMWQQPHSLRVSPKVVVFRSRTELCDGYVSVVDAHSGSEVSFMPLDMPVSQVLPLPYSFRVGPAEQRMFLLISADDGEGTPPTAHLVPASSEAAAEFTPYVATTTFWQIFQTPIPALKGFAVVPAPADGSTSFKAVEIWSVVFGAGSEILEVARRDSGTVHSRIKVLGDRSMLVKYLNPNTVFLATSSGPSSFGDEGGELVVHIIDTVTGRHLFRQVHKGASGPVKAALSENWAVYHYFSTFNVRHEMAVVELYDDSTARSLSLTEAVFSNSSKAISSTNPIAIKTLRQSFFFNHGVRFISVTHTSLGISAKRLLIGTTGDQVYALDKRFVDPRRPLGTPTAADKEERLMPYKPDLGLNPPFFVTYDKAVAGLRGVDTFPTTLESTTLIFAYGLDLSYTRLAPSKSFDMLDDDFSYALLVATLLGMAGLGAYLQITKQQNELAKKWA